MAHETPQTARLATPSNAQPPVAKQWHTPQLIVLELEKTESRLFESSPDDLDPDHKNVGAS
jgi:hypothetical protein